MSTPEENFRIALEVASERFERAIVAWNFTAAAEIQHTIDGLLDDLWVFMQQREARGPQEAA